MKKQRGSHTWDLTIQYHRCPDCGVIIESREDYVYELGQYIKHSECPHCHVAFKLKKNSKPRLGPFFGEGDKAEIEWGN